MESFLENVTETTNGAAMVLGYPVLLVCVVLIGWFGTRVFRDIGKIFNEMRYERWKRRNAERDWDNIESSWVLEPYEEDRDYDIPVQRDVQDHRDTLVLPDDFHEQLYNYQQEENHERS